MQAYDGSAWKVVDSSGFSTTQVEYIVLAFQPNSSVPYVAYQDVAATNANGITVMRFDGSSWVVVGSAAFSTGQADNINLAFQPNTSIPFVAFADYGASPAMAATVMAYDGNNWVLVGSAGFSASTEPYVSLAFQPSTSKPFVLFSDSNAALKATVMAFNGSDWAVVGTPGFSLGQAIYPTLAFQPSTSMPYASYTDYGATPSQATTVMAYDSSSWFDVGITAFSAGGYTSLAFQPNTTQPVAAFTDTSCSNKATVKRYTAMFTAPPPPPS